MTRKHVFWIAAIAASSLLTTCGGSKPEPMSAEPSQSSPDDAIPNTETTGACDDQTCVGTEDCCKGFVCGFDPGRSNVQRYCLKE